MVCQVDTAYIDVDKKKKTLSGLPLMHKKYTNSFVNKRISVVHTDTIIRKGGNSFLLNLVQFSVVVRQGTCN